MNWYLAKIVYSIICGEGEHMPQFDEQIRLIAASTEAEAFSKATALGLKEQDVFFNSSQQIVQWRFINVPELYPLTSFIDGAEVYSRITEAEDAAEYMNMVHQRASYLQSETSQQLQIV